MISRKYICYSKFTISTETTFLIIYDNVLSALHENRQEELPLTEMYNVAIYALLYKDRFYSHSSLKGSDVEETRNIAKMQIYLGQRPFCRLPWVCVVRQYRNQGLSRALLECVFGIMRQSKISTVYASPMDQNAREWLGHFGFVSSGGSSQGSLVLELEN